MNTPSTTTSVKTMCPKCHNMIQIQVTVKVQDVVTCPKCKISLEVTSKIPLTLSRISDQEEKGGRGLFNR